MEIISKERFQDLAKAFTCLKGIMVVGDIGIDKYTYGEVQRISPEAPVPIVQVTREWFKLGLAANITHNLKTLGVKSTLFGVIGEDKNSSLFENLLEECELNTWGIIRSADRPTTYKERITTNSQQICRVDYESSGEIGPSLVKKIYKRVVDLSPGHDGVIIEDYGKGTVTKELIQSLLKYFKK